MPPGFPLVVDEVLGAPDPDPFGLVALIAFLPAPFLSLDLLDFAEDVRSEINKKIQYITNKILLD